MSEFNDRLAAAKAGDEHAFVELFRAVQPALLRYLGTLGGALADDAAADTWLTVVRDLNRFDGDEAGWRAWVFTIGHSRLRDAQRKAARTPIPVDAGEQFAALPGTDDVAGQVVELVTTEAALALIGTLPRTQAEAVLLRHVAGLDVRTAAQVLGRRPGAVRVATHRGLARLAELVEGDRRGVGVTESTPSTVKEVSW